ncbi:hypothetical protein SAMN02927914_06004 [Mesorhizobium qingshengii]|uniref:Uncharacterized protein n=1 Tax=Mesorhizobium qingshengii TaxID=1165689 RepID=A0A1G5ZSV2_9HYPH|nr:hypothetical protein SAMN02927914_06004 [Mesorhizobium qingshengii]
MLGKSWPLEIKLTVGVWLLCLLYSIGIGLWVATGHPVQAVEWLLPIAVWWVFNFYVVMQFITYRALGMGFLSFCWRMLIDPSSRYPARDRIIETMTNFKRRPSRNSSHNVQPLQPHHVARGHPSVDPGLAGHPGQP